MGIWAEAAKRCAAMTPAFKPAADVSGFESSQRAAILKAHLPVPFALPDATVLLEMGRFHFGRDASDADCFVGVGRKGQSFLEEMMRHHAIRPEQIINDGNLGGRDLKGKFVLIVDDAIHTGETMIQTAAAVQAAGAGSIRALVVLASEVGIGHVRDKMSWLRVNHVLAVPEEYYTGTYQRCLSPAMGHYRGGSLSNRPCKVLAATAASYEARRAALDALRVLSAWSTLEQTPLCDAEREPIFRGTLDLREHMDAQVRRWNGGQEYEQAKVRVFVDVRDQLTIHASGVYYPEAEGPLTEHQLQALEVSVCTPMLGALMNHVQSGLLALGYSVRPG